MIVRRKTRSTLGPHETGRHRVLMVHALGGMRGPARSMASLAPSVARDVGRGHRRSRRLPHLECSWHVVDPRLSVAYERLSALVMDAREQTSRQVRAQRPSSRCDSRQWALRAQPLRTDGLAATPSGACSLSWLRGRQTISCVGLAVATIGRPIRTPPCFRAVTGRVDSRRPLILRWSDPPQPNRDSSFASPANNRHTPPDRVRWFAVEAEGPPRTGRHDRRASRRAIDLARVRYRPRADSTYVQRCRSQLNDKGLAHLVRWEGATEDIDAAYRRMDILLVPSFRESWCRVAMEGMAIGLPVVGTDIPGMRELFAGVTGALTFPIDRPDIGQDQLRALARDINLRRELSRKGREAMRVFDVVTVRDQLIQLYGEMSRGHVPAQRIESLGG